MPAFDEPDEHLGTTLDVGDTETFASRDREFTHALPVLFRALDTVLRTIMVIFLAVLVISVGANVFGRFVLDSSLAYSDELARFLFVWVIFLGAALAHLHREHISVDLLVLRLPASLQRVATVVQELLILTLVVALLVGAREVLATDPGNFPLLGVPYDWMNLSVPVCAVVMGLVTAHRIAAALVPARQQPAQEA